jgi:hypothetical protein
MAGTLVRTVLLPAEHSVAVGDTMGYARARIAESLDELGELDAEIAAWHFGWDKSYVISRHRTQLDLLAELTRGLIGILASGVSKIDLAGGAAAVYAECRQADTRLHYVRKLWRYYADKFDQRAGPEGDPMAQTLRAADEVIWSCWKTALKNLGMSPEFYATAPLAYLSPQFAASTTHRTDYPRDLGPSLDSVFAGHVRQLPIPVIALPPGCQRRPWWLVVAAHEVGHHIQWSLPGVEERTRDAVTAAVDGRLAAAWPRWHQELFADACAVLLTGPAAIWAITELETGPVIGMTLKSRYPPPPVRLAVARAVAGKAGLLKSPFTEREVPPLPSGDPDGDLAELLGYVPAVADALLGVTSDNGAKLCGLASMTARAYDTGVISRWADALLAQDLPIAEETLSAARFCVAGSVAAWESIASTVGSDQELAERTADLAGQVRGVLPDCAEPGARGGPSGTDVETRAEELARQFAAELYAIDLLATDELAGSAGRP